MPASDPDKSNEQPQEQQAGGAARVFFWIFNSQPAIATVVARDKVGFNRRQSDSDVRSTG